MDKLTITLDQTFWSAAAVVVAVIVFILTTVINNKIKKEDEKEKRIAKTIEAYSKLNSDVLYKFYFWNDAAINNAKNNTSSDLYKEMRNCLDAVDIFASLCNIKIYDSDIVCAMSTNLYNLSFTIDKIVEMIINNATSSKSKKMLYRNWKILRQKIIDNYKTL